MNRNPESRLFLYDIDCFKAAPQEHNSVGVIKCISFSCTVLLFRSMSGNSRYHQACDGSYSVIIVFDMVGTPENIKQGRA